ncbi:MAG: tetratricopeptide repeat protein [Chloroflexota bacterium]
MATYSTQNESLLGRAWANHREGRHEAAVADFDRILRDAPNDIDANFGLGLAQKALGRYEQAIASFEKTKEELAKKLKDEPGDDRWEMLTRMCDQRIAEIRALQGQ